MHRRSSRHPTWPIARRGLGPAQPPAHEHGWRLAQPNARRPIPAPAPRCPPPRPTKPAMMPASRRKFVGLMPDSISPSGFSGSANRGHCGVEASVTLLSCLAVRRIRSKTAQEGKPPVAQKGADRRAQPVAAPGVAAFLNPKSSLVHLTHTTGSRRRLNFVRAKLRARRKGPAISVHWARQIVPPERRATLSGPTHMAQPCGRRYKTFHDRARTRASSSTMWIAGQDRRQRLSNSTWGLRRLVRMRHLPNTRPKQKMAARHAA